MRKEIKRSILLWPLAASATISVASLVSSTLPLAKHPTQGSIGSGTSLLASLGFRPSETRATMNSIWDAANPISVDPLTGENTWPGFSRESHRDAQARRAMRTERAGSIADSSDRGLANQVLAPVRVETREMAGLASSFYPVPQVDRDQRVNTFASAGKIDLEQIWEIEVLGRLVDTEETLQVKASKSFQDVAKPGRVNSPRGHAADVGSETRPSDHGDQPVASIDFIGDVLDTAGSAARPNRPGSPRTFSVVDEGVLELLPSKLSLPASTQVLGKPAASAASLQANKSHDDWSAGWPATPKLQQQLTSLARTSEQNSDDDLSGRIATWMRRIDDLQTQLRRLDRIGDRRSGAAIDALGDLADSGFAVAEGLADRELQVAMLRVAHAINRRVAVWKPIWQSARLSQLHPKGHTWMVGDLDSAESEVASNPIGDDAMVTDRVQSAVRDVLRDLDQSADAEAWRRFLLIDEIRQAMSVFSGESTAQSRSIVAQRFLSRLNWHALQDEQTRWLRRDSVTDLAAALRPWTHTEVDYPELLRQIERQESDAIDLASIDIATAVQSLRYSDRDSTAQVARSLDVHYRNANVRFAISGSMLNRLLPAVNPREVAVNTTMLGAKVRGTSRIASDLSVDLRPAADRWSLHFQTLGDVSTRAIGHSGPVSLLTTGSNRFVAAAPIEVTQNGVDLGDVQVDVRGRTKLRGVRSQYDGWPLVGALVRGYASSKFDQTRSQSTRIASSQLRRRVAAEMDQQLDQKIDAATDRLSTMVLGPLGKMDLDPQVVDMETTRSRLLARYRLAGDWQLAAFTPRPRAPRTSLMSVQAHQSAINNTLEQLVPRKEPMPIDQVITQAAGMFGQSIEVPDEVPSDVTIQFARTRPVTIEIEDNRLWVTLRIVQLRRAGAPPLTNFIVRAAYRPDIRGLSAFLVRDGHLRISGPGMSMRQRLPARAVFNKVLSPNRPLPMTLPSLIDHPAMRGLAISQFELRDGWIGIAISEQQAPRIALKP